MKVASKNVSYLCDAELWLNQSRLLGRRIVAMDDATKKLSVAKQRPVRAPQEPIS